MNTTKYLLSVLLLFQISLSPAQEISDASLINPDILSKRWEAGWITHPTAPLNAFGVFYFRNVFVGGSANKLHRACIS